MTLTNILERPGLGLGFAAGTFAPVKSAFLDDVDVAREQQHHKYHHFAIDKIAKVLRREGFEHHCPWHQKDDFYVEQDEYHRDQIEFHRESRARRADRIHTALIRHQLGAGL